MAGDTARLGVVNLNGRNGANLGLLDIEEAVARLAVSWYFPVVCG